MYILGIETSCDETSVALIHKDKKTRKISVIDQKTTSQIDIHREYGGVVPEIAGRMHAELITPIFSDILKNNPKPDAIAVAAGPGLITGLLMGVEAARTYAYLSDTPLIAVNHLEGHIYSVLTDTDASIEFPAICLLVSGGHTELVYIKKDLQYEIIGKTRDDAAGECFDKGAKLLGLPYPGGPKISQAAQTGNRSAIDFPRPMITDPSFDFSFAGLKTAVKYYLDDHPNAIHADVCASFETAIIDTLVSKTKRAVKKYTPKTLIIAGGVSANQYLREKLQEKIIDTSILFPLRAYTTDNAAMIATAGAIRAEHTLYTPWNKVRANPNWRLEDISID